MNGDLTFAIPTMSFGRHPTAACLIRFTFKYLPNIIQKFCTYVTVRDTSALTA
jgi:hypothetical protein